MPKFSDLTANAENPRTISDHKLEMLKKALLEFGDLGGVIFNIKTKQLVGGHQRVKAFEDAEVTIEKKYPKPTKVGTVAEGHVIFNGERYKYREVSWSPTKEKAANIAANKGAGEWNLPQLGKWLQELSAFDVDFDTSLTMFDDLELDKLLPKDSKETKNTTSEIDMDGVTRLQHECPKCGFTFGTSAK